LFQSATTLGGIAFAGIILMSGYKGSIPAA